MKKHVIITALLCFCTLSSLAQSNLFHIEDGNNIGIYMPDIQRSVINGVKVGIAKTEHSSAKLTVTISSVGDILPNTIYPLTSVKLLDSVTFSPTNAGVCTIKLDKPLSVHGNIVILLSSNDEKSKRIKQVKAPVLNPSGSLSWTLVDKTYIGPTLMPIKTPKGSYLSVGLGHTFSYSDVDRVQIAHLPYIELF